MGFKPRHYVLIAILIGLAIWNYSRTNRIRRAAKESPATAHLGPTSPNWRAFDNAARLRDAPAPQFTPALVDLRTQANADNEADAPDLRNCLMWLEYYRHSGPIASGTSNNFGMLATSHVQSCMAEHRDVGR